MASSTATNSMTLEQFEQQLLDGERWVELIEGRFVRLSPPDDLHGDIVRNLARSLANFLSKSTDTYACFELPLVVQQTPPTVRSPAISCFRFEAGGSRFAETDKLWTETVPVLVIEVASTNERRAAMAERVRSYRAWGVAAVWVIDPITRHVHQFFGRDDAGQMLKEPQVLLGHPVLPGFSMPVSDLFRQPDWMKSKSVADDS